VTDANTPTARGIIAHLYEYGDWANDRLLARAALLSDAQLRQKLSEGAQPILESFVHLLSADRRWLARWQEVPLPAGLTPVDLPTIAAVRRAGQDLALARQRYIAGLDDAALAAPIRWQDGSETRMLLRWQGLVQAAHHGTQHRSEIAAMLTDFVHSPGDLDFGLWCRAAGR
jgi:uncharacterized damage-inducible protein DinB